MKNQQGQALITLLFFMIIGVTLLTAAAFVTLGNVSSTSSAEQGTIAYFVAESGAEDALLQVLRYPPNATSPYTGGTFSDAGGTATVTVTSTSTTITIVSTGTYASAVRKIQVQETNGSNGWQISSWQEIN